MDGSGTGNGSGRVDIAVSLGLIAIAVLPLLAGGFSGWGYLVAHLLLPLAAALCLLLRPRDEKPNWLLPALLATCILLVFLPSVYQGQVLSLYLLAFPCGWIIADTALRHSAQRGSWLLPAMCGSTLLTALLGLVEWISSGRTDHQVASVFGLHNPYAGFLLLGWPLGLLLASRASTRGMQLFGLIASSINLLVLVLTYSRAAWLCLLLQLVFIAAGMLLGGRRGYGRALGIGAGALVVMFLGLLAIPPVRSVLSRVTDFAGYSFQGRLRFWDSAWQMFAEHPLKGVGLGNFAYVYPQYQKDYIYYSVDPHSWPLQLSAELGVAGLLLALALIIGFIWWALRVLRCGQPLPWCLAIVAAVGGSLAHAAVDFDYTFSATNVFLGALLAIGSHAAMAARPSSDEAKAGMKLDPLGLACAVLVLLSLVKAPSLTFERFILDQMRGMQVSNVEQARVKFDLLNMAIRYNPRNHMTRYQRASLRVNAVPDPQQLPPAELEAAREDLDAALACNPLAANAMFLRGTLNPARPAASREVEQAIEIDPYNYPDHYYGWAVLADDPAEQLRRLELGLERIPITEPITPSHVRPTFYPLNGMFAQWYERMTELTDDPELKREYRSRAAAFRTYFQNNQFAPKDLDPNV
ncbi:O-antigen ligase family protein [bacterium]|nr:O-antigen ligase family protein [bacterium]UNM08917.1 MAG: O-antigen ligase family protein [Planctomycetales bacterium]